uniref:Large ribosomal subunit protein eL18 n=1 Tax=Ditylenchus dipsaci TaxID=166011 RepID=A0A915EBM7_9BILA
MGIDLCHKYDRKVRRTAPKSEDPYLRVLVKLYRYLANPSLHGQAEPPPLSIARLVRNAKKPGNEKKIAVVAGTVTDDKRLYQVPAMTVAALRFTTAARARIIKAGGEAITFDQLALRSPKGENTLLVQGPRLTGQKILQSTLDTTNPLGTSHRLRYIERQIQSFYFIAGQINEKIATSYRYVVAQNKGYKIHFAA